jgi:hypothetical protein
MLLEFIFNLGRKQFNFAMRLFIMLPLLSLLTSCTTTHIPGLDRILFSDSSAKVGPLVAANVHPTMASDAISDNDSIVESVSEYPASSDMINLNRGTSVETDAVKQYGVLSTVLSTEENDAEALVTNVKPEELYEFESPKEEALDVSTEKKNKKVVIDYGAIAGKVILIGVNGEPLPATGTLIALTRKTIVSDAQNGSSKVHVIDMQDKEYKPRYSTISAGDQVVFVNKDNIQHNVFSSSGNNAFDLGTYGSGLKRAVT